MRVRAPPPKMERQTPAYCGCIVKTLKGKPVHQGTCASRGANV